MAILYPVFFVSQHSHRNKHIKHPTPFFSKDMRVQTAKVTFCSKYAIVCKTVVTWNINFERFLHANCAVIKKIAIVIKAYEGNMMN